MDTLYRVRSRAGVIVLHRLTPAARRAWKPLFWLGLTATLAVGCAVALQLPIATPTRPPIVPPPLSTNASLGVRPSPSTVLTATVTPPAAPTATGVHPSTPAATATMAATAVATAPDAAAVVMLPTVTPTPPTVPTPIPAPAWPAAYRIQGTFTSETRFPNGETSRAQGSFVILHQTVANAYGANRAYSLSGLRADGGIDTSAVFLVDDYIAVTYAEGDWIVLTRNRGSVIAKAIQPITDLATALQVAADRAEFVAEAPIDGVPTRHIRVNTDHPLARELVQPVLGLTGELRDLSLDVWLTVSEGYVLQYSFAVEIASAPVVGEDRQAVLTEQSVSWTYRLTDDAGIKVGWPEGAPIPGHLEVAGFAQGEFPLPPQTESISVLDGVPALLSLMSPDDLASFFRVELAARGWHVSGDPGLLRCTKGDRSIQLLISADTAAGGTRVTILQGS